VCSPDLARSRRLRWEVPTEMKSVPGEFGNIAEKLARNPLGIIALFIVLVYGFVSMVTGLGGSLTPAEKLPLIYFLVFFPVLVLGVFAWLVSRHSTKLFAPSDFRNEENYVRILTATASLAVASAKTDVGVSPAEIRAVVESVQEASPGGFDVGSGRSHVLWVDDRPDYNVNERSAFEALGVSFALAHSTDEAVGLIKRGQFAAIISDLQRPEGDTAGYSLLELIRSEGIKTPFFVYTSVADRKRIDETIRRGGQGHTNSPHELFNMVMRTVVTR